jgi:hypothetical protein
LPVVPDVYIEQQRILGVRRPIRRSRSDPLEEVVEIEAVDLAATQPGALPPHTITCFSVGTFRTLELAHRLGLHQDRLGGLFSRRYWMASGPNSLEIGKPIAPSL